MNTDHIHLQVKLYRLTNLMIQREQVFFKRYGLTQKQFNMLRILRGSYPQSVSLSQVSERLIDKSSDITRLAARLTHKNLISITANQNDRRYKDASITKSGLDLLSQIDKAAPTEMSTGIEKLDENECQTLSRLIDKIHGDGNLKSEIEIK